MALTSLLSRFVIAATFTTSLALTARAQTIGCTVGGPGGAIPTSGTGGGGVYPTTLPPNALALPLAATPPAGAVCVTEVRMRGLTHTWVGDVQFVLTDPSGAMHNLFDRPGYFSCDYGGDYTIVGQCQGANTYPTGCSGATILPSGSYDQDFNDWPSGSAGIDNTPLNSIPAAAGTWTLTAYDWAGGDLGTITSWEICFGAPPPVPAPGAAPALTGPASGVCASTLPVALQWGSVSCATSYDVDLDGVVTTGVLGNSLNVSPAAGAHAWTVRAANAAGAGPWAAPSAFNVPLPAPTPGSCSSGGLGGAWPSSGAVDGTWPTVLPTGQLDSPLSVTATPGNQIVAIKLLGFSTTWVGDQHFVLEDPNGGLHNVFYRPGSVSDSFGLSCDATGGDYTIVSGCYLGNQALACDTTGLNFTAGLYEQNFGDWPSGSANIVNTPLASIPVVSGVYVLHCYDWYVFADNGAINGWELCFSGPSGPTTFCTPTAPGTSHGCVPTIAGTTNPDVAHSNGCVITVSNVEGQQSGIVFYGVSGTVNLPWCSAGGNSFLCVKAPLWRTNVQIAGGTFGACDGVLALDWNAYQLANPSAFGNPWSAGDQAHVQGWFRDPPSCKTTFLSEALELTYLP